MRVFPVRVRFIVTGVLSALSMIAVAESPDQSASQPRNLIPEALWDASLSENEIVTRVRNFDILQNAMADWDQSMSRQLAMKGQADLAADREAMMRRRYAQIERAWREVINRYPNNARAVNYFGEVMYDHAGDQVEGLRMWKLAESLDGKLSEPKNNLALYYLDNGDYEQGIRYLDAALKLDPDNADYLYNVSQIYMIHWPQVQEVKKWDEARVYKEAMEASKKAMTLKPHDFSLIEDHALNYFAAERFNITPDWAEAAGMWQTARSLAYESDQTFNSWLNEARCWIRASEFAKAESCLQEAAKIMPDSDAIRALLERARSGGQTQG
ncbi:MAG: hypothetical protein AMXMBFR84_10760 [Candidatus Hydrogenedentota bacterium]